jgi:hypothetical protein
MCMLPVGFSSPFLLSSELQLLSNLSIFFYFWCSLLFGKECLSSGFLSLFSLFHVWVFLFPSDGTATLSSKVLWCILNCPFLGSIVGLFVIVFSFRNCGAQMSIHQMAGVVSEVLRQQTRNMHSALNDEDM